MKCMKRKMKNVFTTVLLSLLCLLMFHVTASAATGTTATIGSKKYSSLQKAVTAVKNGQTIKLQKNILVSTPIESKNNVKFTLDLNKHKITTPKSKFRVTNDGKKMTGSFRIFKGNVIIVNGTFGDYAAIKVEKDATLTIKGGTYWQLINFGKTTVSNAKFINKWYAASYNYAGTLSISNTAMKAHGNCIYAVNGKLITKAGSYQPYSSKSKYPQIAVEKASVSISGGTFTSNHNVIYNNNGKVSISGGTYKAAGSAPALYNNTGTMIVKNGAFSASNTNALSNIRGSLTISGGTFKNKSDIYATLYCGQNSKTVIQQGTVSNAGSARAIDADWVKKFVLSGGTFKSNNIESTPIWIYKSVIDGQSAQISIAKKYQKQVTQVWS